jgi:hypothetical protein
MVKVSARDTRLDEKLSTTTISEQLDQQQHQQRTDSSVSMYHESLHTVGPFSLCLSRLYG